MEENYQIDKLDRQILSLLVEDARAPYSEIAKKLIVSPGTVHGRVKKMEQAGIIKGSSLTVNYVKLGYTFTAYVGIFAQQTSQWDNVVDDLRKIPEVTVADFPTGRFSIFCKIRCRDTQDAKRVIDTINRIPGVTQTESMISLEESINSKDRLMKTIFSVGGN